MIYTVLSFEVSTACTYLVGKACKHGRQHFQLPMVSSHTLQGVSSSSWLVTTQP